MRTKPYHLHVIYADPHTMGEGTRDHFHHDLLIVNRPIYADHQENQHPPGEWISFAAQHHATTKQMQENGKKIAHVVGVHPEKTDRGREEADKYVSNLLDTQAGMKSKYPHLYEEKSSLDEMANNWDTTHHLLQHGYVRTHTDDKTTQWEHAKGHHVVAHWNDGSSWSDRYLEPHSGFKSVEIHHPDGEMATFTHHDHLRAHLDAVHGPVSEMPADDPFIQAKLGTKFEKPAYKHYEMRAEETLLRKVKKIVSEQDMLRNS